MRSERKSELSRKLFQRAKETIPGGVNSPVRAFGSVGGDPLFITRSDGPRVYDADGNEFLDFVGSWGPMILGHNQDGIKRAVCEALRSGTSFGAPTTGEIELAELVVEMVPSVEVVRMVNSGTEATRSAVRLARAATGRPKMVKFRGGYHGHADAFLVEAGSGAATLGVPSSPGVTPGAAQDTLVAEYNDLDSVQGQFDANPGEVACVIVEPVAGNMGCVPPVDGFLEGLREICSEEGAVLIFDEVMTGFRVAAGGAQERFGVLPDLTTMGKVIGGGLPVGAYGGREDLMRQVAPDGPVYQAGTLSGNPLATAAGKAALSYLRENPLVFQDLEDRGRQLEEGVLGLVEEFGYPLTWTRVGSMASLFFTADPVTDWHSAARSDRQAFKKFFWGMLDRGFYLAPSPFEALFLSAAHTSSDISSTLEAVGEVLGELYEEGATE
jgi:glutamate-1-semialdehyde 2,1-aminomutase